MKTRSRLWGAPDFLRCKQSNARETASQVLKDSIEAELEMPCDILEEDS